MATVTNENTIKEIYSDWQSGEFNDNEALHLIQENIAESELINKLATFNTSSDALAFIESHYNLVVLN